MIIVRTGDPANYADRYIEASFSIEQGVLSIQKNKQIIAVYKQWVSVKLMEYA